MGSKFYDNNAALQMIGCVILRPSLMDADGVYFFNEEDFTTDVHRITFGTIYNLHEMGATKISLQAIEDYLKDRPESYGIYKAAKGGEWLQSVIDSADLPNFDYYYQVLKKMTLLREYNKAGVDVSFLYDPDNNIDIKEKQTQKDYIDTLSLTELADLIETKVLTVRDYYVDNATDNSQKIGDTVESILANLQTEPEVGAPFMDAQYTAVTRGARLGKFFLRSAPTGVGNLRAF